MNKVNKNFIAFALAVFVLAAFSALPAKTFAYTSAHPGFYVLESNGTTNGGNGGNTNGSGSDTTSNEPVIYSISPAKMRAGVTEQKLTIRGANFTPSSVARINGEDRPTSYINSGRLTMYLENADTATDGKNTITVYNQDSGEFSNTKILSVGDASGGSNGGGNGFGGTVDDTGSLETQAATDVNSVLSVDGDEDEQKSRFSLSASANKSGNGFLPDTLLEWLLFIVLLFLFVKLFRKIWTSEKEKNAELKHA